MRGGRGSDVPCGDCTACCASSQFVHVAPDETDTLAHIPPQLLFPAPGLPRGHLLLGYDERGCCPMLVDNRCSIYEHRPRACRVYDCRVFSAAGLQPDRDKPLIARRVRRWRFSYVDDNDRARHEAVRSAADFLAEHPDLLPAGRATNQTQLAAMAVEVHDLFHGREPDLAPDVTAVQARLRGH